MEKKWTDQELQELFEKDSRAFDKLARTNEDARFFALLFATLPRMDSPTIPADLSERVLGKLEVKETKSKKWQAWGWGIGIAFAVIAGIVMAVLLAPDLAGAMGSVALYVPLILLGILVFAGTEYLDQKMVWRRAEAKLLEQ